ncbi:MAG: MoxR family ATPase [Planctomycetaceae bacterium]
MTAQESRQDILNSAAGSHRRDGSASGASAANASIDALEQNISSVLLGKPEPVRLAVVALLAGGHMLIEDAPGVGKTSLAKAMARSLNCDFTRLQFTPDMLPSDILGSSVYLPNLGQFEFRQGPIFTNVLLADEINRTTPRTQSALLEAMSEGQVSIEGETYPLNKPFFVLATQNPFEYEGTYPLPENQLDRFMLCTDIGYPDREIELEVLTSHRNGEAVDRLKPVLTGEDLQRLQATVREIEVEDSINGYLLDIVASTRDHDELQLGVSPRGALTLYRAAQAMAMVEKRQYVIPDDVKRLAVPVLAHRIVASGLLREGQRERTKGIMRQILGQISVPS